MLADGLQAGTAARAEAEAGFDHGLALRTVGGARLAQDEVEDDPEAVGDKDGNQRPKRAAHTAAASVFVDVANQDDVAGDDRSGD
jgi:hypothetical protein